MPILEIGYTEMPDGMDELMQALDFEQISSSGPQTTYKYFLEGGFPHCTIAHHFFTEKTGYKGEKDLERIAGAPIVARSMVDTFNFGLPFSFDPDLWMESARAIARLFGGVLYDPQEGRELRVQKEAQRPKKLDDFKDLIPGDAVLMGYNGSVQVMIVFETPKPHKPNDINMNISLFKNPIEYVADPNVTLTAVYLDTRDFRFNPEGGILVSDHNAHECTRKPGEMGYQYFLAMAKRVMWDWTKPVKRP